MLTSTGPICSVLLPKDAVNIRKPSKIANINTDMISIPSPGVRAGYGK